MNKYMKFSLIKIWMLSCVAVCVGMLSVSCDGDDLDEGAMYTFTGETVASFCQNTPELTKFYEIAERGGTVGLLKVYGHFTCFVPTNAAIERYLSERGQTLDDLTQEQLQRFVYNSVIRNDDTEKDYMSVDFEEGALPMPSMADRSIVISISLNAQGQREFRVNKDALIVSVDNEVHNGVVHVVDRVVEPSENSLESTMSQHGDFNIWAQAFVATGYDERTSGLYDPNYVNPYGSATHNGLNVCDRCKLGYTLFCEPDALLNENGITDLASLERWAQTYYGTNAQGDYTNRENALNKFVAYHILPRQMSTNSMIYNNADETVADNYLDKRYEYYETMLKNRLIEVKAGNKINTQKNGECVRIDEAKSNIDAVNGYIHTLTDMMVYDEDVMRNDVLNKRIRFDFFSCAPAFTNNNIRWKLVGSPGYTVTSDFCGTDEDGMPYFTFNSTSNITFWASDWWTNYQADEMLVSGFFDFRVRLLPVPPGNWEVRVGYRAENWRAISQLFIDGQIAGIPVDMTIGSEANDLNTGWESDDSQADNGIENDKLMRNHGYMKAPASVVSKQLGGKSLRTSYMSLRIIIGQYNFDDYAPHEFRAKNVEGENRSFHMDYIEYIPVSLIRSEDRD